ncbi:MAG: hypothetical protein FWH57_12550 [Oscillospiraceae bacterium]|nr:hypothetical protein [Oscillospiraceae bacterium]
MLDVTDREEIAHIMHIIVESDITPKLNLLIEGHQSVSEKLVPVSPWTGWKKRLTAKAK